MWALAKVEINLSENDTPPASKKLDSNPPSPHSSDVPEKGRSIYQKKEDRSERVNEQILADENKPPNPHPKFYQKKKDVRRVTTSPATPGSLPLKDRTANDSTEKAKAALDRATPKPLFLKKRTANENSGHVSHAIVTDAKKKGEATLDRATPEGLVLKETANENSGHAPQAIVTDAKKKDKATLNWATPKALFLEERMVNENSGHACQFIGTNAKKKAKATFDRATPEVLFLKERPANKISGHTDQVIVADTKKANATLDRSTPEALFLKERTANKNSRHTSQAIVADAKQKADATLSTALGDSFGKACYNVSGQKRKADDYSDIENDYYGRNEQKANVREVECIDLSFLEDSDVSYDKLSQKESEKTNVTSASGIKKQNDVNDLLPSSSEDENSNDEKDTSKDCSMRPARNVRNPKSKSRSASSNTARCRSQPGQSEWFNSFHDASNRDCDKSSASSDVEDEHDEAIRRLEARNWLTSSSRGVKLAHLDSIANDNHRVVQLLLWDEMFDYNVKRHQFDAIIYVAGFVSSFPFEMKKHPDAADNSYSSDESDGKDETIQEMLCLDEGGRLARSNALNRKELRLDQRGMILADEMGLGKTIEALGGAVLRNAKRGKKKPTLIVTPQDDVQNQWIESLGKAGVEPARIRVIGETLAEAKKRGGNPKKKKMDSGGYIICTRYKIQSEVKNLFNDSTDNKRHPNRKKSLLFDLFKKVPVVLIKKLRREYNIDKGREDAGRHESNESRPDRVTRLVKDGEFKTMFETIIIDECHFLRNVLALWGIGAALLGAQAKRTVLLSGTPYNNGSKDMSALMTFIDPRHPASKVKWWDNATAKRKRNDIVKAVSDWREAFMLRRTKDIIDPPLPPRERSFIDVPARPSELGVYEAYEAVFLKVLNQLQDEVDDSNRKAQRELIDIMMSCMACMRMSLIHPILPGGREVTLQFSPSRLGLLHREEKVNEKRCVICGDKYPTQKVEEFATKANDVKKEADKDSFRRLLGVTAQSRSDDNIMDDDNDVVGEVPEKDEEKGPIIELGGDICKAAGSECCHFAHERCIEIFLENGCQDCPRCYDLASRIHIASATCATGKKVYCQEVGTTVSEVKGFTASAKLEMFIQWFKLIPKDDKAIIFSFFKGSLDLIEGILFYDMGIECCRYDGDIAKEKRSKELDRFTTSRKCRILLASVQSGGTGLNITAANHIIFLDRWFNPQIHEQAESRCHRIGQTKNVVKIAYLDMALTVDVVMKLVNTLKERNAEVLLADGTSLGHHSSTVYNELPGVIGDLLKTIIPKRHALASGIADEPLFAGCVSDLENMLIQLREAAMARASQKKASVKTENSSNSNGDNSETGSLLYIVNGNTLNGKIPPSTLGREEIAPLSPNSNDRGLSSYDGSENNTLNGGPTFPAKSKITKHTANGKMIIEEEEKEEENEDTLYDGFEKIVRPNRLGTTSSKDFALKDVDFSFKATGQRSKMLQLQGKSMTRPMQEKAVNNTENTSNIYYCENGTMSHEANISALNCKVPLKRPNTTGNRSSPPSSIDSILSCDDTSDDSILDGGPTFSYRSTMNSVKFTANGEIDVKQEKKKEAILSELAKNKRPAKLGMVTMNSSIMQCEIIPSKAANQEGSTQMATKADSDHELSLRADTIGPSRNGSNDEVIELSSDEEDGGFRSNLAKAMEISLEGISGSDFGSIWKNKSAHKHTRFTPINYDATACGDSEVSSYYSGSGINDCVNIDLSFAVAVKNSPKEKCEEDGGVLNHAREGWDNRHNCGDKKYLGWEKSRHPGGSRYGRERTSNMSHGRDSDIDRGRNDIN